MGNGPPYSACDCPEIGPLTSRLLSTITLTFVGGYDYGGKGHGEHFSAAGQAAGRRPPRDAQELETRNFPPASRRHPTFGTAKRMRRCGECFQNTADTYCLLSGQLN